MTRLPSLSRTQRSATYTLKFLSDVTRLSYSRLSFTTLASFLSRNARHAQILSPSIERNVYRRSSRRAIRSNVAAQREIASKKKLSENLTTPVWHIDTPRTYLSTAAGKRRKRRSTPTIKAIYSRVKFRSSESQGNHSASRDFVPPLATIFSPV